MASAVDEADVGAGSAADAAVSTDAAGANSDGADSAAGGASAAGAAAASAGAAGADPGAGADSAMGAASGPEVEEGVAPAGAGAGAGSAFGRGASAASATGAASDSGSEDAAASATGGSAEAGSNGGCAAGTDSAGAGSATGAGSTPTGSAGWGEAGAASAWGSVEATGSSAEDGSEFGSSAGRSVSSRVMLRPQDRALIRGSRRAPLAARAQRHGAAFDGAAQGAACHRRAAVRTLVISDLHLGARLRRDVLRSGEALGALLEALGDVDRLVLLGDVVELLEGRPRQAMAVAEPVLRVIGARMGVRREVIVVPGNHDADLLRPWLLERREPLAVDARVPRDATPLLARLTAWLEPAQVGVRYPGVWLSDRVWATHGHYLDRHLLPEAAYGIARGALGRLPRDHATPADYERAGGPSLTRLEALVTRWLPRPLAELADDLAELLRAATMPGIPRKLLHRRTSPLTSGLLGAQMRRASLPALARVVHRLEVDAEWVVFGHVHRAGPLAGDDLKRWSGPVDRPRIVNSGSWVYEPLLVHHATPPHPYWPGGAILLEDDGDPRVTGLLDHVGAAALR